MSIATLEGRRLHAKLCEGFLPDMESPVHAKNAVRGSQMLRDAILRAKGYPVAEPEVVALRPAKAPVFRTRKVKRGRPFGSKGQPKIRRINTRIVRIREMMAGHFGLSLESMILPGRSFSHPRQIAIYLARKTTPVSLMDIAFHFGLRDHTTVLHAISQVEKRVGKGDAKTIAALRLAYAGGIR